MSDVLNCFPKMKLQKGMAPGVVGLLELLSREQWQTKECGRQGCFTRRILNGPGNAADKEDWSTDGKPYWHQVDS